MKYSNIDERTPQSGYRRKTKGERGKTIEEKDDRGVQL